MRVIVIATALLASVPLPSRASAQTGVHRPVAPSTGFGAAFDARYQRVTGLGANDLHAGQLGLAVDGHWAPSRGFELGAGWGLRASVIELEGWGSRTRVAPPPLRIWVGTGGRVGRWAFGLRLTTGASFALVGLEDGSSNGEHAFADVEAAAAHRFQAVELELRVAAGAAWAGDTAVSGIGRVHLAADVGPTDWRFRPYAAAAIATATDLGWGGELLAGLTARLGDSTLRVALGLEPWRDPSADIVRLWITWHQPLDRP